MIEKDELKHKDWQVLIARMVINNNAKLNLVLANQQQIIALLTDKPLEEIKITMKENLVAHQKSVEKIVMKDFPDYEYP